MKYDKRKGGEESVSGKLMALGGFGNHRYEWDKIISEYIRTFHELSTRALDEPKFHVEKAVVPDEVKSGMSTESKLAHDWMYNFQYWFTEIAKEIIQKDLKVAKSNNLVITGGCALNCVANYHIWKDLELKGLYVPPNPNDCGLSLGFAYRYLYTKNKHNKNWVIGIPVPETLKSELFTTITLSNWSVATSGTYANNFTWGNTEYSHIINPETGYPIKHDLVSATVVAKSCTFADAIATSVMVMGFTEGRYWINKLPDVECLLIRKNDSGHYIAMKSDGYNY